jgi:lipoprotein-anchoring transpeptidase ErfK/SrfK
MKKYDSDKNWIKKMTRGRAARIIAVAVADFLCFMTLLEYVSLRLEWQIPVFQIVSGEEQGWMKDYRKKEIQLDESNENELLTEETEEIYFGEVETESEEIENGVAENGASEGRETKAGTMDMSESDGADENPVATEEESTAETEEAEFPYYIKINRQQNCITIYALDENGEYTVPYKAMICSTGLYNATPRGTFHTSTKYMWRELYGGVYGQYATRINGGILFHSVPYYRKSKSTLCTDKYNKLGQQASMGCVRLTVEDAKWIAENCPSGTTVEIYDDEDPGPLGKPEAMKIDTDSPNKGWDPTDPDEDNPWREVLEDN